MSKYALVTTIEKLVHVQVWTINSGTDGDGLPYTYDSSVIEDILKPAGTICCFPVYDGVSPYIPPNNTVEMKSVPDGAEIGDTGY